MSHEPITYCRVCAEPFDVYRAPDERVCDGCQTMAADYPPNTLVICAEPLTLAVAARRHDICFAGPLMIDESALANLRRPIVVEAGVILTDAQRALVEWHNASLMQKA